MDWPYVEKAAQQYSKTGTGLEPTGKQKAGQAKDDMEKNDQERPWKKKHDMEAGQSTCGGPRWVARFRGGPMFHLGTQGHKSK